MKQETSRLCPQGRQRQSNYELLRFLAMLAIIIYHICWHPRSAFQGVDKLLALTIYSFTEIHVTLFVLISGYFGIHLRWKGVVRILLACVLIGIPFYLLACEFGLRDFKRNELLFRLFPISRNTWWFLGVYFQLMLFSPALNIVAEKSDKAQLRRIIAILTFIVLVLGGVLFDPIDEDGTNIVHFSYLYLIGRYLRLYPKKVDNVRVFRTKCLTVFLAGSLFTLFLNALSANHKTPFLLYCNPGIIGGGVSVFLLFGTIRLRNTLINKIASSALVAYMIHDETLLTRPLLRSAMTEVYAFAGHLYFLLVPFIAMAIYLMGILVDKLYVSPISNLVWRTVETDGKWKTALFDLFKRACSFFKE